jgi:hypothetical protein
VVEAVAPVALTRGWLDLLSHFLFIVSGQDEPSISRNEIKMVMER